MIIFECFSFVFCFHRANNGTKYLLISDSSSIISLCGRKCNHNQPRQRIFQRERTRKLNMHLQQSHNRWWVYMDQERCEHIWKYLFNQHTDRQVCEWNQLHVHDEHEWSFWILHCTDCRWVKYSWVRLGRRVRHPWGLTFMFNI